MGRNGIYVVASIAAPLDDVWRVTQDAAEHVRWDVRFSKIVPERAVDDEPVHFRYERAVPAHGLSLHTIRGTGVSLGERQRADGTRTSALRFHTDDRLSPIRSGRGYWRYEASDQATLFMTGYDYQPGWGLADRIVRPIIGWATAWSFDRLRIWLETGVEPERWPLWSVLWFWRRDRPRASNCRRQPVSGSKRGDQLAGAPATLATLSDPGVRE